MSVAAAPASPGAGLAAFAAAAARVHAALNAVVAAVTPVPACCQPRSPCAAKPAERPLASVVMMAVAGSLHISVIVTPRPRMRGRYIPCSAEAGKWSAAAGNPIPARLPTPSTRPGGGRYAPAIGRPAIVMTRDIAISASWTSCNTSRGRHRRRPRRDRSAARSTSRDPATASDSQARALHRWPEWLCRYPLAAQQACLAARCRAARRRSLRANKVPTTERPASRRCARPLSALQRNQRCRSFRARATPTSSRTALCYGPSGHPAHPGSGCADPVDARPSSPSALRGLRSAALQLRFGWASIDLLAVYGDFLAALGALLR